MVREALTAEKLNSLDPREVAALLVARRAEGLTDSERQLLSDWLAKDEAHRRQLENADRAWQSFEDSGGDEILAAMREHAITPPLKTRPRWVPAAAAAAVMCLAVGITWFLMRAPETFEHATARAVEEVQLPDGSTLTLDAESALTGRFDANGRRIELSRGRALFAVSADASRPFSVTAAGRRVVAVGTRFDVHLIAGGLSVSLLEGRVDVERLDAKAPPVMLSAGQQYVERAGKVEIREIDAANDTAVSWQKGFVNFDDQPLTEAAAVMNRYSQDQIVIGDTRIASLRVSGQFRAGDSLRFAQTLAEMHGLRVVLSENGIELVR